nr:uncharacterized protein LOC109160869 [Ipomoea trifida]
MVHALAAFNARQQDDVIEIGFGGLLDLQVTNTPGRSGHWLVSNFHLEDMSLHLPSRSKISITRDVIVVVFGLPCETVTITKCDSQVSNPLLSEWRENLRQPKGKVTVTALYNELLTHNNAGIWFKRHFSVVVVSTLIESERNGYVNQKIAHMFDDTNRDSKARLVWVLIEMLATICRQGGGRQSGQHKRKACVKRVDFKAVETEGGTRDFCWGVWAGSPRYSPSLVEYPWATNYSQWWRGKKQSHYATLAVEHTH